MNLDDRPRLPGAGSQRWFGLAPLWWLLAWWGYRWAASEISPTHPDVARVLRGRARYGDLLDSLHHPRGRR